MRSNLLNGRDGDDSVKGGIGDDSLLGGGGRDTASYASATTGVTVDLAIAAAQGTRAGIDTLGSIENLAGSSFADGLRGSGAANVLNGHGGDDSLLGQSGGDTLDGGGGTDHLDGGDGTDLLIGGRGFGDVLDGGAGPDTLAYGEVLESSGRAFDTVVGFNATADVFDLPVAVGGIDPRIRSGRLDDASFNGDLARAANAAALLAQHAVQFTPDQGSHAGETFLLVDGNGVAGYQVHQDFVFHLQGPRYLSSLGTDRFV